MAIRLSTAEASRLGLSFGIRPTTASKHKNVRTWHDSPVVGSKYFMSGWEAGLCAILDHMVAVGEVRTFLDQITITLQAHADSGKRRSMRVDFMIIDLFGRSHWWDAKGRSTAEWDLKRDLAWKMHKIDVKAVKKGAALPVIYEDDELDTIRSNR